MRKPKLRPVNQEHYRKISREMDKADPSGSRDEYYWLIGAVTTLFEQCETDLFILMREWAQDEALIRAVFSKINSRSARTEVLRAYVENRAGSRPTKRHKQVAEALERYDDLGVKRDRVAHALLMDWRGETEKLLLQPGLQTERKHVAGKPTYHFDVPQLVALANDLDKFDGHLRKLWGDQRFERIAKRQRIRERASVPSSR